MSVTRRAFLKSSVVTAGMVAAASLAGCAKGGSTGGSSSSGSYPNGKIAAVRNMQSSDHTTQFFAGITAEGNALGFQVDTFMSDGDDSKMVNLLDQVIGQGYKALIISSANEGYQAKKVKDAVDKGMKVVCFDCAGEKVDGVNYNTQDDESLTDISIKAMVEKVTANGGAKPVKFIDINAPSAILPFQRREDQITVLSQQGEVEEVSQISNILSGDAYSTINTAVSTALSADTNKEIKGVWAASSSFLDGAVDAIEGAGRDDVVCTAVDISNTEITRLLKHPCYYCVSCVDPYIIGVVNARLAVLEILGSSEVPAEYSFEATSLKSGDVKEGDSMTTVFPGTTDEFDTEEIQAVREKATNGEAYDFGA